MAAPKVARRHVESVGAGWDPELLDVAVLLTSELVANAVAHGEAPVEVDVFELDGLVRVEVGDGGDGEPGWPPTQPMHSAESGRGLLLVIRLATAWGHRPHKLRRGKIVWFDLAAAPAA